MNMYIEDAAHRLFEGTLKYLEQKNPEALSFWVDGTDAGECTVEMLCDVLYALYFLGRIDDLAPGSACNFAALVNQYNLPGWAQNVSRKRLSIHNCAYAFGVLNLLSLGRRELYETALSNKVAALDSIIDERTGKPRFPRHLAHHSWRVSHWLGGVCSMLLSVGRTGVCSTFTEELAFFVRSALAPLTCNQTGLIKAYTSAFNHRIFNAAYKLRHDPSLGEFGGIAHILWFDHATESKYATPEPILAGAREHFYKASPFMESVPYCIDFDIVQLVRTAADQLGVDTERDRESAEEMMVHISSFIADGALPNFTVHKLVGALAAYEECALLVKSPSGVAPASGPKDIIRDALWL